MWDGLHTCWGQKIKLRPQYIIPSSLTAKLRAKICSICLVSLRDQEEARMNKKTSSRPAGDPMEAWGGCVLCSVITPMPTHYDQVNVNLPAEKYCYHVCVRMKCCLGRFLWLRLPNPCGGFLASHPHVFFPASRWSCPAQ